MLKFGLRSRVVGFSLSSSSRRKLPHLSLNLTSVTSRNFSMDVAEVKDYKVLSLGDFKLQSGITIGDAKLAFKTFGALNAAKDNVIVYPTWYSGQHYENEWLVGEDKGLDPRKYFIIIPNMFGNGLSSSPSNTPRPQCGPRFPRVTFNDNIRAQHILVSEHFGIQKIRLVLGWSMGSGQTYTWASYYPDMVERALPFEGSAKTSEHNFVFLEGVKAALTADVAFDDGWYEDQPWKGLRSMARVYAGWGFSQAFYRHQEYKKMGFTNLEDFLVRFWEGIFATRDANNLLTMLDTWQTGDISDNEKYNGDFVQALKAIKATTILLPCKHDLYFPPEDTEFEAKHIPNNEFRISPSIWGHFAGGPGVNQEDVDFHDQAVRDILEMPASSQPVSKKSKI